MGATETPENRPVTHNQLGDVSGAAVQAQHIDNVTFHVARPVLPLAKPRQVPVVAGRLVNRKVDFARIERMFGDTTTVGVGVISGVPGIGKSWFARRVAELSVARFPAGQLYANFAGAARSTEQATSDVLSEFLSALGVAAEIIPATGPGRVNLYRTLTGAEPVLVVLDEVSDPAVVRQLVPSAAGSVVLVTSNDQLSELVVVDGAQPLPLPLFDGEHGVALLVELVGERITSERAAAEELVRQCGGLPLALQVVATRLRLRPGLSVARLAEQIADLSSGLRGFRTGPENTVSAVFDLAYQALPDSAAQLYRDLGSLPEPEFSVELAAAAVDQDRDAVEDLLGVLVDVNLLSEAGEGRFRFHGLLWRHAREQDGAPRVEVVRRAAEYLLRTAAFADLTALGPARLRCTPHEVLLDGHQNPFTAEQDALDWLDRERSVALGLLRASVEHGWFEVAWQLTEAMTAVFVVRRYLVDWTVFTELGVRAAQAAGATAAEARLRSFGSRAWSDLGDLDRAAEELRSALALPLEQPRLLASVEEMRGRWEDKSGRPELAQAAYRRAEELFQGAQDARGAAYVSYFLGTSLATRHDWAGALDVLTDARARIQALPGTGNDRMTGRALLSIGQVQRQLGRPDEALAAMRAAVRLFESGGYVFYAAQAHTALADLAEERGEVAEAVRSLRAAIELNRRLNNPDVGELLSRLAALTGE